MRSPLGTSDPESTAVDTGKPQQTDPAKHPYSSALYLIVQMISMLLGLNLVLPMVLHINWTGNQLEQGLFMMVFGVAYIVMSFAFLAVAGYFAIAFEVAKNLKKLTMADVNNKDVAQALAIRVLTGNQPRWLISMVPAAVPALAFAITAMIFNSKLPMDGGLTLLQASLLQGLISFILCLPFILKSQKTFRVIVAKDENS